MSNSTSISIFFDGKKESKVCYNTVGVKYPDSHGPTRLTNKDHNTLRHGLLIMTNYAAQ